MAFFELFELVRRIGIMNFAEAMEKAQDGEKVCRANWDKGHYIVYIRKGMGEIEILDENGKPWVIEGVSSWDWVVFRENLK